LEDKLKELILRIDDEMETTLSNLGKKLGGKTRAEVLRIGVSLLVMAVEAGEKTGKIPTSGNIVMFPKKIE
jgi:hypothetical protein